MSPRPTRAPPYHCMSPSAATGHALNNTPGRWWIFFRGGQCIHHFHRYIATRGWEIGIGAETSLGSDFTGITSWMSSSATGCLMNWRRVGAFWGRGTWVERNLILIIWIWSSLDWFCARPFTRIFSYSKKGVELLRSLWYMKLRTLWRSVGFTPFRLGKWEGSGEDCD